VTVAAAAAGGVGGVAMQDGLSDVGSLEIGGNFAAWACTWKS
jgi:hypothetical protein